MEKIYPFSTKNSSKASFRIADILHQQQQQQQQPETQLLAQHLMMAKNGKNTDLKSNESKGLNNELLQHSKTPSPPSSVPDNSSPEHSSTMKSDSGSGSTPMKPTPMYSNFPLPFPLGFHPAFHPAAAYLNYADAIHKASSARMWPYFHPYGGYLMPQCGSKRKGGQVRFTPQQTQNLERRFSNHKYLSPEDRRKLAMELSLSDRQVKTWFQNRRAKWRRANNATGTSNGHSNQHTVNSSSGGGGDDISSESSDDDDDLSQKPLQMYLHHQQYYKQMKELQKQQQQQQQKDTASDNDDNVEVN